MSKRKIILLVCALILTVTFAKIMRGDKNADGESDAKSTTVLALIAARDVSQGSFIHTSKDFEWVEWPKNLVNDNYILQNDNKNNTNNDKSNTKKDIEKWNGAVARRQILIGEPISKSMMVHPDDGGFMAAVLQAGKRAVSIAVDSTSGNAGFIFPGDKVDLIITHNIESVSSGRPDNMLASETFVKNVRILAVDQKLDNPDNIAMLAKTVTLEVSPTQVEKINVAKDMGKISLSLRALVQEDEQGNQTENYSTKSKSSYTRDSDVSTILTQKSSTPRSVKIFHGSDKEEVQF